MKNKCHICIYWTPETGCKHYLPDSETGLKLAGYEVSVKKNKVVCKRNGNTHRFESMAKAASTLIHQAKNL